MNYQPVIGLEIHLHAKTKTKMFCRCAADYFHTEPNSHVCPVCMGLPGALPIPNEVAVEKCIQLALSLGCTINAETKFDRKNYFYPDLPKGYQISQYDLPIGFNGNVTLHYPEGSKSIKIKRVHMEEDTGKSAHEGSKTLLDYNKSGLPLIEIVTEPDFSDVNDVTQFSKKLQHLVRFINVSNANMEKGQLRYELNISLRPEGATDLPNYKVEIKNIASISVLEKVIQYESKRQAELLEKGERPLQETRGIRDLSGVTYSQRTKEEADDYRYFPEPDIPPLYLSDQYIESLKEMLPELPDLRLERYQSDWKLDAKLAQTLLVSRTRAEWFEQNVQGVQNPGVIATVAKWLIGDILAFAKSKQLTLKKLSLKEHDLAQLAQAIADKKVTSIIARQILMKLLNQEGTITDLLKQHSQGPVLNLDEIVQKVIDANPKVVADVAKNPNAVQFLLGQVMKETRGQADPNEVKALLTHKLT